MAKPAGEKLTPAGLYKIVVLILLRCFFIVSSISLTYKSSFDSFAFSLLNWFFSINISNV
jgi:hypothetical protein